MNPITMPHPHHMAAKAEELQKFYRAKAVGAVKRFGAVAYNYRYPILVGTMMVADVAFARHAANVRNTVPVVNQRGERTGTLNMRTGKVKTFAA